ncbi:hypothetical protein HZZ00_37395 (plasmid) [Streptomyces sp. NEAU-sy36]|uniref:DUF6907 domain-containing protein n=1 Tax=unclassified Streptomyces TaxID=2593676 RepID=UPI0015D5AAE1|nr:MULTISPECIES: hypothetical protein [unclassified Streptomyces]QLJ06709.1 hypothetical protein HZZ00_37395 [Streptomyces sp. NEAU-sy36]
MATTEDAVRFVGRITDNDETTRSRVDTVPPTDLEVTLRTTVDRMRRHRLGIPGNVVNLEDLAAEVMEAAIRDQHTFVLCSSENPASPTAEEHRWAQSIAGAVASRFHRATRRMLRTLKAESPTATVDTTQDSASCPAWCHKNHPGDDWHESKPISFKGPGDMYDENHEPLEVMWAALSEVPPDEVEAGADPGPYIYVDTLSIGQGSRLDLDQTDILLSRLRRYLAGLETMRDQLAALTDQA